MKRLITALLLTPLLASAEVHEISFDESYSYNGIELGYDNIIWTGVDTDSSGMNNKFLLGIDVMAVIKFFKKLKPWDKLDHYAQVERIFGTINGVYAFDGSGTPTARSDITLSQSEKDLGEIVEENARTEDKESKSNAERAKHLIGNNLPTWAGAVGVGTASVLGYNAIKDDESSSGSRNSKSITLRNAHDVVINEFGSGSGSTQNTGQSAFDREDTVSSTTPSP